MVKAFVSMGGQSLNVNTVTKKARKWLVIVNVGGLDIDVIYARILYYALMDS